MLVVVLADGETYTEIEGCKILQVPDDVVDPDSYVRENADRGTPVCATAWVRDLHEALSRYRVADAEAQASILEAEQAVQASREAMERRTRTVALVARAAPDGAGLAFVRATPWETLVYDAEHWHLRAGCRTHLALREAPELARILGHPVVLALSAGPLEVLPGDSPADLEARYQILQERH